MRDKLFVVLRLVFFLTLLAVLLLGFLRGEKTPDLLFFGVAGVMWFGVSLLINVGRHNDRVVPVLNLAVLVMADTYVVVSGALHITRSPLVPIALGCTYGFFVTVIFGLVPGTIVAASGLLAHMGVWFFAWGKLMPSAISGVAAVGCGLAWRMWIPLLRQCIYGPIQAVAVENDENDEDSDDVQALMSELNRVQERLEKVGEERDLASETIDKLEGGSAGPGENVETVSPPRTEGHTSDGREDASAVVAQVTIAELQGRLRDTEERLKTSEGNKDDLAKEMAELSKELEVTYSNAGPESRMS